MDSPIAGGIVSSRSLVEEGQLLKIKGSEPPEDYYQLEVFPGSPLMLVARHGYQNEIISALVPAHPEIHPGMEVRFVARQPESGTIQGPVVHAFLAGDVGCALQIANFGPVPADFGNGRFEVEIQRLSGSIRLPVVKQSFQYSFSGSELLTAILGHGLIPEDFAAGSWARFHSI